MKKIRQAEEVIHFDDPRMSYYYKPWQNSMTGDGPVIKTADLNDYVDMWYVRFQHLEWWSEKAPTAGIAGFQIWGKDWTIQEMLDLYSPTKDSKIELIKAWDFPEDDYTVTLFNIGEKNPESLGNDMIHAYFKVSNNNGNNIQTAREGNIKKGVAKWETEGLTHMVGFHQK